MNPVSLLPHLVYDLCVIFYFISMVRHSNCS